MVESSPQLSEEQFLALRDDGRKHELVDGEARELATGVLHEVIGSRLTRLLGSFADEVGVLTGSSAGFRMSNGNIRSPDVALIGYERLPDGVPPTGFGDGAPDLCIEIISPSEFPSEIQRKLGEYFESGARQVWHLFPEQRRIVVYRSLYDVRSYGEGDDLDASDILPGFRCPVSEIFAVPARPSRATD